jgi:hypothetical protein
MATRTARACSNAVTNEKLFEETAAFASVRSKQLKEVSWTHRHLIYGVHQTM